MKNLIKKTWIPIITLGTFLTAVIFFGSGIEGLTIINQESRLIGTYNWTYYTIDLKQYLINLESSLKALNLNGKYIADFPMTPYKADWTNILSILKFIANCFIFVPNFFVFILNNTALLLIKIALYPVNIIMTLLGLNTSNLDYIVAIKKIINFSIDYIQYL